MLRRRQDRVAVRFGLGIEHLPARPDLLRRVFAEDALTCPCGGRRSVTAFVTDQRLARSLLVALGLPAEPATFAPARDPPQAELAWDEPA